VVSGESIGETSDRGFAGLPERLQPAGGLVLAPSLGRCLACEGPLVVRPSDDHSKFPHIEPVLACPKAGCSQVNVCLTCFMLVDWFHKADFELERNS